MALFKKTLETTITINAPSGELWKVVGTLEHYASWNTSTIFTSPARVGNFLLMRVKLGLIWLPVPVLIQHCNPQQGLRWIGGIPFLITGSHYFRVESLGKNTSRLVQAEDFAGLLVPLLLPLIGNVLNRLYTGINNDTRRKITSNENN